MRIFFLFPGPYKVLVYLYEKRYSKKDRYSIMISRKNNLTHSHVCGIVKMLHDLRLIEKEPAGRMTYITLTEKGKSIAKEFERMVELLEDGKVSM